MTATATRTTTPPTTHQRRELAARLSGAGEGDLVIHVDGQPLAVEVSTASAVLDLLRRLSRGEGVLVSSIDELLTTSQAADLLGVSRTYVCRLMDDGVLPFQYRGTHRRLLTRDIVAYLDTQRGRRREALERIQDISRQSGLYDGDAF